MSRHARRGVCSVRHDAHDDADRLSKNGGHHAILRQKLLAHKVISSITIPQKLSRILEVWYGRVSHVSRSLLWREHKHKHIANGEIGPIGPRQPASSPATPRTRGSTASKAPRDPSDVTLTHGVPTHVLPMRVRPLPLAYSRWLYWPAPLFRCASRATPTTSGSAHAARAHPPRLSCRVPSRHRRLPPTPPSQTAEE